MNTIISEDDKSYIKFTLLSSPSLNDINFIKYNKNSKIKRIYAKAEVKTKYSYDTEYIFNYYKGYKIAYLSFIELNKKKFNSKNNTTYKIFTTLSKNNTINTYKRKKYYNKQYNATEHYTISKGYGKILLEIIEKYLKNKNFEYLILIPSKKSLIHYYENLGYKIQYIPNNMINKENNNEQLKHNNEAVSQFMIMYKKL
jgi:hypothetical protein